MDRKKLLSYLSGSINEALLLRNEFLVAEKRILKGRIQERILHPDAERATLAEIGKRLVKKALEEVATIVKPETILAWHRPLIAKGLTVLKTGPTLADPGPLLHWSA